MIPISDDNTLRRSFPFVTLAIIAVNILVFVYQLSLPSCGDSVPLSQIAGCPLEQFIYNYSTIPAEIVRGINAPFSPQPTPIYLSILTSMFMHGGFSHIGFNMLYLFIFGDNVEDSLGHIPYLIFYLVCGTLASLAQIAVDPNSTVPNLGASGAIAGVLGAYLVFFPQSQVRVVILPLFFFWPRIAAIFVIGIWGVTQFANGFGALSMRTTQTGDSGVAYFAHIGGFVAGIVLAFLAKSSGLARIPSYQFAPLGFYDNRRFPYRS